MRAGSRSPWLLRAAGCSPEFLLQSPGREVGVPRGARFTFTRMEPRSPDDRDDPLTVSFDEVQGPYRRRMILSAAVVAVAGLALLAVWRLGSLPRGALPRSAPPHAVHRRGRRRPAHRRVAVGSLPSRGRHRSAHQASAPRRRSGQPASVIAPNVSPSRPKPEVNVGPGRPYHEVHVGQSQHRQFQYLGR